MPDDATILAVDVGASRARMAIVRDGVIGPRVEHRTAELAEGERGVVDRLVRSAASLVESAGRGRPTVVGVGLAAAVDGVGSVLQPRDFGIPGGSVLRDELTAVLGVPVIVDNDANLAALAEHQLGAARGARHAAVLTLGTNIGLGLILDGRVHHGARGAAGEAGLLLVPVTPTGERVDGRMIVDAGRFGRQPSAAPIGYAWIEELVGGGALATAAPNGGSDMTAGSATSIGSVTTEDRRVLTAGAFANPRLRPLADRAVEGWALIIADLSVVLDLEVVVLTGGVAADAAHLLEPLQRRVAELVALAPEIRLGVLGPDAELLGADLLARSSLDARVGGDARAGLSAQSTGGSR